jgi:cytoskeletal protein CcmA (bactofilin family)
MNGEMNRICRNQNGQIVVLMALLIPVIFGFIALSIDLGYFVFQKDRMQHAVDLSALGAIQKTGINPVEVIATAIDLSEKNGIQKNELTINHPYAADINKLELIATRNVEFYFLPFIGIDSQVITVNAVAERKQKTIIQTTSTTFDYAVFSGSSSSTMTMRGNGTTVTGNIHSNDSIRIMGNDHVINGNVTAKNGVQSFNTTVKGLINQTAPIVPMVQVDFNAYQALATKTYPTNTIFSNMDISGVWMVNGNCQINGGLVTGKGILLVNGDLQISGNGLQYLTSDNQLAIYVKGNVQITATGTNIKGTLYAPNGNIRIAGSGNTFYGALIANSIEWAGADVTINGSYDLRTPSSFSILEDYTALIE